MPSSPAALAILAIACLPLFATSQTFPTLDHSDGFSPYGAGFAPDVVPVYLEGDSLAPSTDNLVRSSSIQANVTSSSGQESRLAGRAAHDFYLRVMPLGASITQGQESTDQNGYRKWLRSQLRWKGWQVNMVGSKHDGSMQDDDNDGHPGWTIGSVHGAFTDSKWMMPNLVLVNAGLNDCNNNMEAGAVDRLRNMTDDIFESIPGVTVILSTLLTNKYQDPCTERISQGIRELVDEYRGKRIGLADIRPHLTLNDLVDGTHPSDYGYEVFAGVWWDAIRQLEDNLQPPHDVAGLTDGNSSGNKCKKVAGNSGPPAMSQLGSGQDDGNYVHSSTAHGVLTTARIDKGSDPKGTTDEYPWHIFFANVVVGDPSASRSAALDDWIRIWHAPNDKNTYYLRQNLGGGQFGASVQFDVDMDCDLGPRYAFADFNNDGLDDFFCLKGSSVWVSLNRGGNTPKFESIGQVIGNLDGYTASDVRIADIDGDGRADFCLIRSDGTIIASRNGGTGDKPTWQGFSIQASVRGVVFSANKAAKSGIVLADLNGDFKSDYMWISDHGSVETWINNRGVGSGIIPAWRSAGVTHSGQEATGIQDRIKFGRIFGSGRRDYIYLKEEDDHYDVVVWENKGSGGTKLKADGNFYCDMFNKGSDDFVWIYQDGHAAELNINIRSPPTWNHDIKITLNVPGPRVGIHLADWDGDGKCDVLVQNKATGALTMYQNNYKQGDAAVTFGAGVRVTPGTCDQGWGVGIFDRGMAVRDIDGDGRADALCIYPDGRITAWLNLESGLVDVGQIKFSEGWDRANIRFADVEASGRSDLLHVDKYTGAVTVFTNNGRTATGRSSFSWTNRKKLYNGINRGETMVFTNQGGLYRADMVHVDPKTNKAWTYYNKCGNSGGDDGPISDPGLPAVGGGYVPGGGDSDGEDYPIVIGGFCTGPDCVSSHCVGPLCVSNDCTGSGCTHGWSCSAPSLCIPLGCIGPHCIDSICQGTGCKTKGCVGPDCDSSSNRCKGDKCISTGCEGDCDGNGKCRGPGCKRHSCTGPDCVDGVCVGPNCTNQRDESGGSEPLDPSDPDDPNDPEDPDDPDDPSDRPGEDICKMKTNIGRCGNGNYPVFDISSGQIRCDVSDNDVDSVMNACQRRVDDNIDFVQKYVSTEKSCCPSGSKKKRADFCPSPNQDPKNPPANQCYATYTCPHALFPNVCGNAKSAILHRGKTSILTHVAGSKKHDTDPWYEGHFMSSNNGPGPKAGWKLNECEVEEYPFGSGDPNREKDGTAVLRLIPGGSFGQGYENQGQANHVGNWRKSVMRRYRDYQQAQNPPQNPGVDPNGLVYCMAFDPSFTAYLPEDLEAENFCNHYGVAFTLVNDYTGNGGVREWDPWFDVPNTGRKDLRFLYYETPDTEQLVEQNRAEDDLEIYAVVPPTWCEYPSPGRKRWDQATRTWNLDAANGFGPVGRHDEFASNRRCEDIPAGTRRRRGSSDSDMMMNQTRSHPRDLESSRSRPRALGAGGFLDPSVYRYFGCDGGDEDEDGVDPCSGPGNPCKNPAAGLPTSNGGNPTLLDPPPPKSEGGLTTRTPIITQPPSLPTDFIDCRHQNEDPGQGINSAYCVCSGSTFSQSIATWVTPRNSCAYTAKPTQTIPGPDGPPKTTDTGACKVCSVVGQNNRECDDLPNCTPTATPTPTPTPKRCITAHNYVHVGQFFTGTSLSVQVWDNGKNVCDDGSVKQFASDTTNWDYDCEDGGKVHVTDNGRVVEYTAGDGYFLAIPSTDARPDKEDCGSFTGPAGTEHTLWCTIWEYAFDNGDECGYRCPIMETCGDRHCDFDGTC